MRVRWEMLRGELIPSRRAMMVTFLALGLAVIATICAVIYAITQLGEGGQAGAAAMGMAMLTLPVVVVLFLIGALMEKRPAPRTLIWLLLALCIGAAAAMISVAMALDPEAGLGLGVSTCFMCGGPITLVLLLPAVYSATKAWPQLKARLRAEREERLALKLRGQGLANLAELAEDLALSREDTSALVEELIEKGGLAATLYRAQGMVYSGTTLATRWNKLLGVVHSRGKIGLRDLAIEMGASEELTKEWLYELVRLGRFSGYINWREGTLYSAEAQALREEGHCPQCGGELELVGKGTVWCGFCGAEVFL